MLAIFGIITVSQPPFVIDYISSLVTSSDSAKSLETAASDLDDKAKEAAAKDDEYPRRFFGCILAILAAVTTSVWMAFFRRIKKANVFFITFLQALAPVMAYVVYFNAAGTSFCITG